jgi:hypothetical protein
VEKFVEEFVRLQQDEREENLNQAGGAGGLQYERNRNSGGPTKKSIQNNWAGPTSPGKPRFPMAPA